jgi:hypothetical protein
MCDFSLEHLASRPAKVGDQLVTTKFGGMYTTGFCSVGEPSLAVWRYGLAVAGGGARDGTSSYRNGSTRDSVTSVGGLYPKRSASAAATPPKEHVRTDHCGKNQQASCNRHLCLSSLTALVANRPIPYDNTASARRGIARPYRGAFAGRLTAAHPDRRSLRKVGRRTAPQRSSVLEHSFGVWRCGSQACLTWSVVRPRKRS